MKRVLCALVIVAAGLLPAGVGSAGNDRVQRLDFETIEVNNCTQEPIRVTGHLLVVSDEFVDAAGASHTNFHFIFQGMKATNLVTGVDYVITQTTSFILREGESGAFVLSSAGAASQNAHGQDDLSLLLHVTVHATVTPSGEPTATFEHGDFECRGQATPAS
jgi:hypothetical protein